MTAILVALSHEQAQLYGPEHGLAGCRVITTDRKPYSLDGFMPAAGDVLLLAGWRRGPHADHVENLLRRALAKRRQRFEDVPEASP